MVNQQHDTNCDEPAHIGQCCKQSCNVHTLKGLEDLSRHDRNLPEKAIGYGYDHN